MRLDKGCNLLACVVIITLFKLCKGDPNKGACNLTITDAKKEDSGTYFFRFEGHVMYNYEKKSVTVTVTDPPMKPKVHTTSANDLYCKFAPGYSIEVNTSVTVQECSCVTIPCSFTAGNRKSFKNSRGFWKNNNKTTVAATFNVYNIWTKRNFHITGDPNKGDCTLTIIDAQKNDSGTYFYRLEGPLNYNYEAKSVTVIVTEPPKKPEVVITSANEGSDKIFYLLIGIVCGLAIVIFSILALKLIARKYFKMNICLFVPMEYDPTEKPPAEDMVENDPNKMYMTVNKPKPKTKTAKDADKQQDSNSIPSDQEEIHYSTIVFKSHPSRASPTQQ